MSEELCAARDGEVLTLTLNRPEKRNALSAPLVEALLERVAAAYDDGTRLVVFRGAGRNFSAGFDFGDLDDVSDAELLRRFVRIEELLQAVHHAPYDTLALAHGRTFGAGADLICACARRVAAPDAAFLLPGLRFGLVLGTRRFAARVGAGEARRLLGDGVTFDAGHAREIGFLTDLAAADDWGAYAAATLAAATGLGAAARADLHRATTPDTRDRDLADLVRSAARPGLKQRIQHYRKGGAA
jgi:enoyl-CoA hydratase/carnithine racemase